MGRKRPGRDVEHPGQELPGDLVHVREHQEQPLRGGEGSGERAGHQRAVHRPGRPRLRLQLPDVQHLAEDVLPPLGRPLVRNLPHGRRGGDGIDRRRFAHGIRHMRRRRVAVHRFHFSGHVQLLFSPRRRDEPVNR